MYGTETVQTDSCLGNFKKGFCALYRRWLLFPPSQIVIHVVVLSFSFKHYAFLVIDTKTTLSLW